MTNPYIIIVTAVLASLLEIIDTSIVNVAIPTMMGNLGATLEDISWVVTGYIIANAIVLPLAGWLGYNIGRKKYYTGCILLFTASSAACGLAPNLGFLVAMRVVQGFAGGALLPTSQALIQEAFPPDQAGMASAIYGMSIMIGPTLGPTLGGYLTDNFGWRSIFNINIPLGIIAAMMAWVYVEDLKPEGARLAAMKEGRKAPAIDFIGLILLALSVGLFQFVLERGQADDWFESAAILYSSIGALIAIPTFIWWELKVANPVVDLRLFSEGTVRYGTMLMAEIGAILYSIIFFIPVFAATILGLTATQTGELFIPGALASAAMMPMIGMQLRKRDARILIMIGIVILEIAIAGMTHFTAQTDAAGMFWPLMFRGAGMAYLFVPVNTVVLGQFTGKKTGEVAGLLNLSRQIGGSIGIAGLSTLMSRYSKEAYVNLASHVTLLNPVTLQNLRGAQVGMAARPSGLSLDGAAAGALKMIYFRIQRQVFVIGYERVLWMTFFLFALAAVPVVFLKASKPGVVVTDAH